MGASPPARASLLARASLASILCLALSGAAVAAGTGPAAADAVRHPGAAAGPVAAAAKKTNPDPLWEAMAVAAASAKKTHHKTQVDQATNSYATLVANPEGTFTAQQYLAPQRAKVGGTWKPIDTTLARGADGRLHAKATVASIAFSSGGGGPLATVDDGNGHVLSFGWPGAALPAPSVRGDTATYPNVYPGVDLQMVALPTGVRDLLIVHDAKSAANPALKTISLRVSGSGLNVAATAEGGVTARTAEGQEIFGGPTPMMWDSSTSAAGAPAAPNAAATAPSATTSSARHEALLPATVAGGLVRVSPDQGLLTGRSTHYPVTIDPQWTENAQNWIELWSNGKTVYDGSPAPYLPYDTSAVRVGNTGGTLVRSLLSFSAMPLPRPGNPDAVGPYQQAMYIIGANLNLTAQSATCPSTQVWRANPFNTGSNWSNQNGGTGTNLWPGSGSDFSNPIATVGGSTSCAGAHFSPNSAAITTQVQDVYNSGGATYTIGLRASNESSTTSNYGSYFVQNNANAANLTVNFAAEPFGLSTGAGNNNGVTVGNHGNSTAICGTDFSHPGYLPLTAGTVPVSAAIGDWDARPVNYDFALNDNTWAIAAGYNEAQPDPTPANGTMSGGSGTINVPAYAGSSTGPGPNGTNWSTVSGSVQAGGANGLKDGHMYELWTEMTDAGTDAIGTNLNTALNNAINNAGSSYPHTPPCDFIAAMSAPSQPTIASSTFPASGQHITTGYPTVGTSGDLSVSANAAATPIDHFDWALNTASTNEGAGHCGSVAGIACGTVGGLSTRSATATITIPGSGEHWGDNYLYVSAVDKAGNVSPYARYDFFLAQAFVPVSFGDVTGDGVPDVVGVDSGGNLVTYQSNLDLAPGASSGAAGTPNTVQAAPASAGPSVDANGNPTWTGSLYTHRGSERVEPTDDLFAWGRGADGNGHLYYYFNAELLSNSTSPGLNPAPLSDTFSQTRQAVITRPACAPSAASGWCIGYDTSWNSVKQIVALGPSAGGCTITAPTTACKTNLITIEADPNGGPSRVWMFSPAGVGQLRNPILLSTSTAAWDWTKAQVLAPGNAAGHTGGSGGLPDLWAVDPVGTLWQFANTGTPSSLGDLSGKTILGATGQFSSYKWVAPSTDPSGSVDLWTMTSDGQISVLTGPVGSASASPLSPTQTTATSVGWAVAAAPASLEGRTPGTGIAGQLISDKSYDQGTGRQVCLDDLWGNTANSTTVIDLYDCNGTWPQDWRFGADGTIQLMGQNPASPPGKCLDTGGSLLEGAKVTLYTCLANPYQIWKILPSASTPGRASLYNPVSGLCLDDTGGSQNNTNPFQLWQCYDNSAQRFQLPTGPGQTQSAEAESVWNTYTGGTAGKQTNCCGASWSPTTNNGIDGAQEFFVNSVSGSSITFNYYVANAGTYTIAPVMTMAADYGKVTLTVDSGPALPNVFDGYNNGVITRTFSFGAVTLSAGNHAFTFTATGTNSASIANRYNIGIDTLNLVPVASLAPNAALSVTPGSGSAPLSVTADASGSTGGANGIATYTFDFGDGTVVGPQSGASASHSYTGSPNTYVVKVTVTDSAGLTSAAETPVTLN